MSLAEVLLAAGLALLLMVLVAQVLIPSLRLAGQNAARAGLQQQAMTVLDGLERDLRLTSRFGLSLRDGDPTVVAVDRLKRGPFPGTARWEDSLVVYVYLPASRTLTRRSVPPVPPSLSLTFDPARPTSCSPDDLLTLAGATDGRAVWLARNADAFDLTVDANGACRLSLKLSQRVPGKASQETFELSRTLCLRNH